LAVARPLIFSMELTAGFARAPALLAADMSVARFAATALVTVRALSAWTSAQFFGQALASPTESESGLATARPTLNGYIAFARTQMKQ